MDEKKTQVLEGFIRASVSFLLSWMKDSMGQNACILLLAVLKLQVLAVKNRGEALPEGEWQYIYSLMDIVRQERRDMVNCRRPEK